MPNIEQQKKRVRTAGRERLQNLRYRSTVKTISRRLEAAVAGGDSAAAEAEHRELVRMLDKAVSKGVIHANQAANKKSAMAKRAASL